MLKLDIDLNELKKHIENVKDWDDWYELEERIFRLNSWPVQSDEEVDSEVNRVDMIVDGNTWYATTNHYDVDPNVIYLYEMSRWEVFKLLEPDAYQDNLTRKEEYGKLCVRCRRWTSNIDVDVCPMCGNGLVLMKIPK